MNTRKIDIIWLAVDGPVTSVEVAKITGLSYYECSAILYRLWRQRRIDRTPYRVSTRTPRGGRVLGGWIYYGNEQRPPTEAREVSELTQQRKREAKEASEENEAIAKAFNDWIASC